MPNYGAKISSGYISSDAMREFIARLPSLMHDIYGNRNVTVFYGWACNLHHDLLHKPMQVPLEVFPYFIEDSVEQRIFEVCCSDLVIESPDAAIRILLCHESDIHLDGTDDEAIARIVGRFPDLDFRTADEWRAHYKAQSNTSPPGS